MAAFAGQLREKTCKAQDVLIEPGDSGDRIYLILDGQFVVERAPGPGCATFRENKRPGDFLGAAAFSSGRRQTIRALATQAARVAELDRQSFTGLLDKNPKAWHALESLAMDAMRRTELEAHLDRLFGPFGPVFPYVMKELESEITWLHLRSGATLFSAGEPSEGAYLLLAGRLRIVALAEPGQEPHISTVLVGETIGEAALLSEQPHAESAHAARDSVVVRISARSFDTLLRRSSRAMYRIARTLVSRLHRRTELRGGHEPVRTIGVLPVSDQTPIGDFCIELVEILGEHGPSKRLTSPLVDAQLDRPGIAGVDESEYAHLRLIQWLQDYETQHRYLVYQGDRNWSQWSERCARQADTLVVVADADSKPDFASIAGHLAQLQLGQPWSPVFVHARGTKRPSGTARCLAGVQTDTAYHIRRNDRAHMQRLARMLTGRAVGLVLGGGGARGAAHLGVLRAMEELGIPVDMIGGTSIGAAMAGWVAVGYTSSEMVDVVEQSFRDIIDYTLPIASLMSGAKITRGIEFWSDGAAIEDLWIPYACVSTNITSFRPVIHRRGDLAMAVRASVSLPGVLPPVTMDGQLLVDGGTMNNLPVDVLRKMNPFGKIIAIDVVAPETHVTKQQYWPGVSGWRLVAGRLLSLEGTPRVPPLPETVMRSMVVGAKYLRDRLLEQQLADFYRNIQVHGIGLLDFKRVRAGAKIGYDDVLQPLSEWVESGALSDAGVHPRARPTNEASGET